MYSILATSRSLVRAPDDKFFEPVTHTKKRKLSNSIIFIDKNISILCFTRNYNII